MQNQTVAPLALLKTAFESEHAPALIAGSQTHEPALRYVAQLVRHTRNAAYIEAIIKAALPKDYAGNTLAEVPAMIAGALEKGFDQAEIKRSRKAPVDQASDLYEQSGAELFHDLAGRPFIALPSTNGEGAINVSVESGRCRLFMQKLYYERIRKALPVKALDQLIELLRARAIFDGPRYPVFTRVGGDLNGVCHDLGGEDGKTVEITAAGYVVTDRPHAKMQRTEVMRPLPAPRAGEKPYSGFRKFQKLLNLDEERWTLYLAFLISAMRPIGPYPFLAVEGEQGSGKSTACEMTKRIIDPTTTLRASLPETVENLLVMASHRHLSVFDNVSGMRGEISDGLAKLATGGGYEKRKLYSDGDLFSIDICRPFALNGIGDFIHRPDLMDRGIVLRLEAPPPGKRKTEAAMLKEFEALLPELLHDLYTAVSCAIRNLEKTPQPTELRMADAAHWLVAAEPETGLSRGTIIGTLLKTQAQAQIVLVANDPLFSELRRVTSERPFEGTALELLSKVQRDELRFDRSFPKSAPPLSKKLRRLAPALAKAGLIVEFSRKSKMRGLKVSLALSEKEMPESEGTKPRYEAGEF